MKQIIEETLENGEKRWRVMTDRCFFGLFRCKWKTDKKEVWDMSGPYKTDAVFYNLKEAEDFVYGTPKDKVVERRVLTPKITSVEA